MINYMHVSILTGDPPSLHAFTVSHIDKFISEKKPVKIWFILNEPSLNLKKSEQKKPDIDHL